MRGKDKRPTENLGVHFEGAGFYDLPILQQIRLEKSDINKLIAFEKAITYHYRMDDCKDYGVHFFEDDYKFERVWRGPENYIEPLSKFSFIISPDFSNYIDDPMAMQIYGIYRQRWCSAFYAANGIPVVPLVSWGTPRTYDFCFDGLPKNSTVALSTLGLGRDKICWNYFRWGYDEMLRKLDPYNIIWYHDVPEWVDTDRIVNIKAASIRRLASLKEMDDEIDT